jgi:hypothetical protein
VLLTLQTLAKPSLTIPSCSVELPQPTCRHGRARVWPSEPQMSSRSASYVKNQSKLVSRSA